MKLSPTMREALVHIAANGGTVEYMRGGWWITPGTPTRTQRDAGGGYDVPDGWSTTTHTITALVKRGLIRGISTRADFHGPDGYELTAAGRAAVPS